MFLQSLEMRYFLSARPAPRSPDIYIHILSLEVSQSIFTSGQVYRLEVRRKTTDICKVPFSTCCIIFRNKSRILYICPVYVFHVLNALDTISVDISICQPVQEHIPGLSSLKTVHKEPHLSQSPLIGICNITSLLIKDMCSLSYEFPILIEIGPFIFSNNI